ncbi:hypothetical protein DFH08DRAFT_220530 [Mycena albidolilacea]|uniref:Cupredoxin n=1 Tax=Mycena albidolilacea TaxID=1033008 RepID=A0AAD6ZWS8_9AGAR|nr:hypothetical protein DFH08DRAFT_220530 [Mycena albidolilacea]
MILAKLMHDTLSLTPSRASITPKIPRSPLHPRSLSFFSTNACRCGWSFACRWLGPLFQDVLLSCCVATRCSLPRFNNPANVTAAVGDTIQFQFQSKNHSVTQSTFANPCQIQTSPSLGIDSGFQFVAAGSTELPQWSFTLKDIVPLWFFCAQTNPANHCQHGMVFSLNANEEGSESTAAFQARAIASTDGSSSSSAALSSGVASSSATRTSSGVQGSSAPAISSPIPSNTSSPDAGSPLTSVKKKNVAGPIAGAGVYTREFRGTINEYQCPAPRRDPDARGSDAFT